MRSSTLPESPRGSLRRRKRQRLDGAHVPYLAARGARLGLSALASLGTDARNTGGRQQGNYAC